MYNQWRIISIDNEKILRYPTSHIVFFAKYKLYIYIRVKKTCSCIYNQGTIVSILIHWLNQLGTAEANEYNNLNGKFAHNPLLIVPYFLWLKHLLQEKCNKWHKRSSKHGDGSHCSTTVFSFNWSRCGRRGLADGSHSHRHGGGGRGGDEDGGVGDLLHCHGEIWAT